LRNEHLRGTGVGENKVAGNNLVMVNPRPPTFNVDAGRFWECSWSSDEKVVSRFRETHFPTLRLGGGG